MVREILVDWTTASGAGKVSVFHFIEASNVADQRQALSAFLTACNSTLAASTSWTIRPDGRELNTASGTLTGLWSEATPHTGAGTPGNTSVLADATQVLVRWFTDHIVNGRVLRGRTYLPGIYRNVSEGGNVYVASRTAIQNAGQTLAGSGTQLAIWHRPTNGAGGVAWAVDTCSVWQEFAVQRRRRG